MEESGLSSPSSLSRGQPVCSTVQSAAQSGHREHLWRFGIIHKTSTHSGNTKREPAIIMYISLVQLNVYSTDGVPVDGRVEESESASEGCSTEGQLTVNDLRDEGASLD